MSRSPKKPLKFKDKNEEIEFMYYPDIDSENFYPHIWSKKEFYENRSPAREYYDDPKKKKQLLKKICTPDVLKLKNHQIFLRNFLSPETPYNSILVFHGIGTGKTCAGVTIAEGLKDMVEKYNKKIYVIANTLLQGNFQSTLYNISREKNSKYPGSLQCTKTTYYIPPKKKEGPDERRSREKAIREMQKKYYEYMGYIAFVHYVDKEVISKGYDLGEFFSNSVFIIDEAHNLIAKSGTKNILEERRKTRQKLHDIFKVAKNTKLVMLTATPITNEIDDIIVLMNLLRANDNRKQYRAQELTTDGSAHLTRYNLDIGKFTNYVKGYVSYFRGSHPSSFPMELTQSDWNRTIKADMFGDQLSDNMPNLKELGLVTSEMSYFHFYNYFQNNMILERNSIGGTRSRDSQGDQLKIQAATAMYPLESADDDRVGTYDITDVFTKEKTKGRIEKYRYRTKEKFLAVENKNEKYLHEKVDASANSEVGYPLAKYSTKFYSMLYNIINTFGINFIFTRYRTNVGTIPISLLLEQNGYVRYHSNLGKPNEFTGKYREGVNNHLDIRDVKYRCICGYLDDAHNPRYTGNNDYTNPKKHRFLQGTYLRIDGETSDNFEIHRKQLNSPDNKYGQVIKIIVGGQNMREGVDLKYVRGVHIMNPWHNLIQIEQTIGRAIRLCSHAELDDVDDMNVRVFKYVSIPPQSKLPSKWGLNKALEVLDDEGRLDLRGVKFRNKSMWEKNIKSNDASDWASVDEYIYARALNKDYNIKFAERLMKQAAIDCWLNHDANLSFPNDKDGSRTCDYTDCKYDCTFNFKGINKDSVNLDTYDLYFMEPKVQEAQEVIGDLFSRNWALTLSSIVELAKTYEKSLNPDVIYLALDRMLGDPPRLKPAPVVDKYGRYGYLIYRHPFYVFQPKEVMDENLPIYNRRVPSKPARREIDIKDLIKPKKKAILLKKPLRKASPSDRLSNEGPSTGLEMTQGRFSTQIENLLAPIANQDEITLASVLDYLAKKQHEYLIRTRIEDLCKERDVNQLDKKIIFYYMNNFLLGNTKMVYDESDEVKNIPKNGSWVYNLAGHYWTYSCDRDRWIEIHEDNEIMIELKDRQESRYGPKLTKLQRDLSPKLYGFLYDDNKKSEIKFKITDVGGQQVKTKRYSEEINIKTQSRGQVCGNYSNDQLERICDRLRIKYDSNLQRNSLCSLIERELRVLDNKDDQFIWFLNFPNFKRKFDRLEDSDVRSLYSFYQS